ncbi:MAG: peptidase M50 [Austwickia sp.]|jgi:Zn-dependent protease|nr:peptidase M50 [Austwickia sp.]MBK8435302.1 peptidase M50 [Austwickia sp.]MBK9101146.1 peptidase M50 [Austwickia sp.]
MSEQQPPRRSAEHGLRIATISGVPVYLGKGWGLIALVLIAWYGSQIHTWAPGLGASAYLVAAAGAVILLASVLVHEAAHAVAARRFGYPVERVVANLWGGHTAYNPTTATPGRSAVIAVVGPLANLVVGFLCWLALPQVNQPVGYGLLWAAAYANLFVGVFNLLPGLPLDGGFLVDAVVWKATGRRSSGLIAAGWSGRLVTVAVVFWFLVKPFLEGDPPSLFALVWLAFLGALLWFGASQAIASGHASHRLAQVSVRDVARPAILVSGMLPLAEAVRRGAEFGGSAVVVVLDPAGQPRGVLDTRPAEGFSAEQLWNVPSSAFVLAQPEGWILDTHPEHPTELTTVLSRMATTSATFIALRAPSGQVTGVVLADDVERALS